MIDSIIKDGADILLVPLLTSQFLRYFTSLTPLGLSFRHTECIDFMDINSIAAKTWMGAIPLFTYVYTFSFGTWLSILNFILIYSVISSYKVFKQFNSVYICKFIWNYWTIMFSNSIQKFLLKPNLI